jgi:hypothetical protein
MVLDVQRGLEVPDEASPRLRKVKDATRFFHSLERVISNEANKLNSESNVSLMEHRCGGESPMKPFRQGFTLPGRT